MFTGKHWGYQVKGDLLKETLLHTSFESLQTDLQCFNSERRGGSNGEPDNSFCLMRENGKLPSVSRWIAWTAKGTVVICCRNTKRRRFRKSFVHGNPKPSSHLKAKEKGTVSLDKILQTNWTGMRKSQEEMRKSVEEMRNSVEVFLLAKAETAGFLLAPTKDQKRKVTMETKVKSLSC